MTELPPEELLGLALCGRADPHDLVVERIDGDRRRLGLGWWRGERFATPPPDSWVLDLADLGPVLDVWCRTGRRLDLLGARGIPAQGIDTCRAAVAIAWIAAGRAR